MHILGRLTILPMDCYHVVIKCCENVWEDDNNCILRFDLTSTFYKKEDHPIHLLAMVVILVVVHILLGLLGFLLVVNSPFFLL